MGGNRARFCEQHAITVKQYYYWQRRYRQHLRPPSDAFIEETRRRLARGHGWR